MKSPNSKKIFKVVYTVSAGSLALHLGTRLMLSSSYRSQNNEDLNNYYAFFGAARYKYIACSVKMLGLHAKAYDYCANKHTSYRKWKLNYPPFLKKIEDALEKMDNAPCFPHYMLPEDFDAFVNLDVVSMSPESCFKFFESPPSYFLIAMEVCETIHARNEELRDIQTRARPAPSRHTYYNGVSVDLAVPPKPTPSELNISPILVGFFLILAIISKMIEKVLEGKGTDDSDS